MRGGVRDILCNEEEGRGQRVRTDRAGAGLWGERVPIVLRKAPGVEGVRLKQQP